MKLKKLLSIFLVLVLATSLGACGKSKNKKEEKVNVSQETKSKDGGTMVIGLDADPITLNPLYATDRVSFTINRALYDPLIIIDKEGTRNYLAEDIKLSQDGMTYTIKLKKNLKWHDGQALTADDLIFTLDTILNENHKSKLRDKLIINEKPVEYSKIDETTIQIKLPEISIPFMNSIAQIYPIPKHIFEGETDISISKKNETPVGSGPFKFKEWKKGESVLLDNFKDYYNGKPHLDSVAFRIIPDPNTAKVALENGEVSVQYIATKEYEKYKKEDKFNVEAINEGMLDYMIFKFNSEPLNNKDVRYAISHALNQEEIVKGSYDSIEYADKANSILASNTLYYSDKVKPVEYNLDKAKELIKKAGYEKGLKLKLAYINSSKKQENSALIIQQKLKDIGIELEVIPMEKNSYIEKILDKNNKDFDICFNGYVMGIEPDSYKSVYKTGQQFNISQYSDKDIDKKWDEASVEVDKEKREKLYHDIQTKVIEDAPIYPIAYPKLFVALDKKIKGLEEAKIVPIYIFEDFSKLYISK